MLKNLFNFLNSHRMMAIASFDKDVWITNVFYGINTELKIYFISNDGTRHSKQIMKNPKVAFSVAWFNPSDHSDRKGVQGQGICRKAKSDTEIKEGVGLHNKHFPEFASRITFGWAKSSKNNSGVWVIKPKLIKYWDDRLYGKEEFKEFTF